MPRNPNAYGPLTDKRDFSFLDGRAVPMGSGQVKRALKQKNYAVRKILLKQTQFLANFNINNLLLNLQERIFQIVKEMDFAVYRNQRIQQETEDRNQAILKSKFKAKGHLVVNPSDNKSSL